MKKKLLIVGLCLAAVLSFAGCAQEENAQIANPITESTYEGVIEATGISMPAPEGATDVAYTLIDMGEDPQIAQMNFILDGESLCLRVQPTSTLSTDLNMAVETEGSTEVSFKLPEELLPLCDISGLNYDWTGAAQQDVQGRTAVSFTTNDGVGFIAWVDDVTGMLYNLSMGENADDATLVDFANAVFVPMQGEV